MRDIGASELARAMGVAANTVYNWESDRKRPSEQNVADLAKYLGVTPWWLVYGQDPKYSPPAAGNAALTVAETREPYGGVPRTDAELHERTGARAPEDISEKLRTKKPAPKKAAGEKGRGRRRS